MRPTSMSRARGFTLLELMIVVVVVAILAAIAIPNYGRYAYRARRADAQNLLQHIATAQERYYATYNKYTADLTKFGYPAGGVQSEHQYYTAAVVLTGTDGQGYVATATPQGAQSGDACGNLTFSNTGAKGKSGDESNGKCW